MSFCLFSYSDIKCFLSGFGTLFFQDSDVRAILLELAGSLVMRVLFGFEVLFLK